MLIASKLKGPESARGSADHDPNFSTSSLGKTQKSAARAQMPPDMADPPISRPRRILYICNTLGNPDNDRCTALSTRGYQVTAVNWRGATPYIWSIPEEVNYEIRTLVAQRGFVNRVLATLRLARIALLTPTDAAIIYGYNKVALFIAALILRLRGVRVGSMNDSKFDDYGRSIFFDLIKVVMLSPYQTILAATRRAGEYAQYLGRRNIGIYHCGIDTARIQTLSRPAFNSTSYEDRYFFMVARFTKKKNHHTVLDAFEIYASQAQKPRTLVLCGYGELESEIRQRIASSEILSRHVVIRGYVKSDDIPLILGAGLALLLPSTEEQFGIAAVESLAAGVPVIVSSECGSAEIITSSKNGFIVKSDDPDQIARHMQTLAQDDALWSTMSAACYPASKAADVSVFVAAVGDRLVRNPASGDVVSSRIADSGPMV